MGVSVTFFDYEQSTTVEGTTRRWCLPQLAPAASREGDDASSVSSVTSTDVSYERTKNEAQWLYVLKEIARLESIALKDELDDDAMALVRTVIDNICLAYDSCHKTFHSSCQDRIIDLVNHVFDFHPAASTKNFKQSMGTLKFNFTPRKKKGDDRITSCEEMLNQPRRRTLANVVRGIVSRIKYYVKWWLNVMRVKHQFDSPKQNDRFTVSSLPRKQDLPTIMTERPDLAYVISVVEPFEIDDKQITHLNPVTPELWRKQANFRNESIQHAIIKMADETTKEQTCKSDIVGILYKANQFSETQRDVVFHCKSGFGRSVMLMITAKALAAYAKGKIQDEPALVNFVAQQYAQLKRVRPQISDTTKRQKWVLNFVKTNIAEYQSLSKKSENSAPSATPDSNRKKHRRRQTASATSPPSCPAAHFSHTPSSKTGMSRTLSAEALAELMHRQRLTCSY